MNVKLNNNVVIHCKRNVEGSPDQSISLREVEIEPNAMLECRSTFCHLS